jgi:hypothetical protein
MGYLTRYSIKANKPIYDYPPEIGGTKQDVEEWVSTVIGFNPFEDCCKWYEHDEDMRKVSKLLPEILFTLSGEGEENDDIWRAYYLDGKCHFCRARITFDPFDATKLK